MKSIGFIVKVHLLEECHKFVVFRIPLLREEGYLGYHRLLATVIIVQTLLKSNKALCCFSIPPYNS